MTAINKPEAKSSILIVDDEPHNVYWIADYLQSLGYLTKTVSNLQDALTELTNTHYRVTIIDLNIPAPGNLKKNLKALGDTFARFPGLYAARIARTVGHRNRQTIIYSVHEDPEVREWASRMRCTYLLKGRPQAFKSELRTVLSYDPSVPHLPQR